MKKFSLLNPKGTSVTIILHMFASLKKSLYGLKQAPRARYDPLCSSLLQWNFRQSKADMSLFTYHSPQGIIFLLMYVDDLILTGSKHRYPRSIYSQAPANFCPQRPWSSPLFPRHPSSSYSYRPCSHSNLICARTPHLSEFHWFQISCSPYGVKKTIPSQRQPLAYWFSTLSKYSWLSPILVARLPWYCVCCQQTQSI